MKNYDQLIEINQNLHWPYIPDHPHRILIIGGSGPEKINALLNWIKNKRPDIDKIYLFVKVPFESKYQLLINGRENVVTENLKTAKAFIDYSQTIDDVIKLYKDYTRDTFSFLVNNTTLSPRKSIKILEEPIIKWLLARKSKES